MTRTEQVNPQLNALIEISSDEALDMADAADRAVATGEALGPLHGVPIAIKVNSDQAGHATTDGVVAFKGNIAEVDSPHVKKLREAGAVFVGRSNTQRSLSVGSPTMIFMGAPSTLGILTARRGGSSGGASSAVASEMLPITHGNDIGGSIRYPAYACVVVGIRPTVGRVPSWVGPRDADETPSVQSMWVQGPLARTVADLRMALDAMSGFDPCDPFTVPVPLASVNEPLPRPIRVGLLRDVGVATPQPTVNDALDTAAGWLA